MTEKWLTTKCGESPLGTLQKGPSLIFDLPASPSLPSPPPPYSICVGTVCVGGGGGGAGGLSGWRSSLSTLKGRDQWEWIGLWKLAINRHLVRIVVINVHFLKFGCLLGIILFPLLLAPADWIGIVWPNRRGAAKICGMGVEPNNNV